MYKSVQYASEAQVFVSPLPIMRMWSIVEFQWLPVGEVVMDVLLRETQRALKNGKVLRALQFKSYARKIAQLGLRFMESLTFWPA